MSKKTDRGNDQQNCEAKTECDLCREFDWCVEAAGCEDKDWNHDEQEKRLDKEEDSDAPDANRCFRFPSARRGHGRGRHRLIEVRIRPSFGLIVLA